MINFCLDGVDDLFWSEQRPAGQRRTGSSRHEGKYKRNLFYISWMNYGDQRNIVFAGLLVFLGGGGGTGG
jgi:hypothetical protein